ncbi:MAG: hypothetical protein N3B11_04710, partial [Coriobacteriia bacterium]|nr:hypothetical protein [Coriobacteriia bacterium]
MGYVVIGIDRVTGSALLLEEAILPTRQAAVDALRAVASSGQADLASYEVLIVDLDAATPVLVVEVPQPGFEAAEPPESVSASEVPLPAQMPGSEHVVAARLDEPEPVAADE